MRDKLMQKVRKNKKGFTLAELLVVVAIIAVLVAISIPVFGNALGKANHAVDLANVRAAYAEAVIDAMTADGYDGGTLNVSKATISAVVDTAKGGHGSTLTFADGTSITVVLDGYSDTIPVDPDVKFTT